MQKDTIPEPSKELQEMLEEEQTADPSLDGMLPDLDLADKRVQAFLQRIARRPLPTPPANESEEEDIRAESLRRSRARHVWKARADRT